MWQSKNRSAIACNELTGDTMALGGYLRAMVPMLSTTATTTRTIRGRGAVR